MGLDIAPLVRLGEPSWHRSYIGFHRTRLAIARAAGIDLDKMEGFVGSGPAIQWSTVTGDAANLVPLLHHSDCEGEMSRWDCERVADALATFIPSITDEEDRRSAAHLRLVLVKGAEGYGVAFS